MAAVLLDTDVFSFLFKQDSRAERYAAHLIGHVPCLSFMTVAELTRWALERKWGPKRRASLRARIVEATIVDYDMETSEAWARIAVERCRAGRPIACGDCWIAACAVRHDIPLVTHNARHYAGISGLKVLTGT
jgi:tRNA(fMet)-specific endonuclease VapC